jgi:hypothetical protein
MPGGAIVIGAEKDATILVRLFQKKPLLPFHIKVLNLTWRQLERDYIGTGN